MKQRGQDRRLVVLFVCLLIAGGLMFGGSVGLLTPIEEVAATPLNWFAGVVNRVSLNLSGDLQQLQDIDDLRRRNADLEEQLSRLQAEVVSLREISSDYTRLADLVSYTTTVRDMEFVTADVISRDTNSALRTISINRGTRDGVRRGMAVVTEAGLVGRVINVSANAARVMLVTADSSAVSARLQTTRVEGSVVGVSAIGMEMQMLPLNADVRVGDLVLTSGLTGTLPPDLVIGQIDSIQRFESAAELRAQVSSLINFDQLEMVMVITSFEPIDLSIFEEEGEATPAP